MEPTEAAHFLRVEKGSPDAEELAAVTAVVLALAANGRDQGSDPGTEGGHAEGQRTAGWRRPDRQSGFRGPRTWHENPPVAGN